MTAQPHRIGALDPDELDPDLARPRPDEQSSTLDSLMEDLGKALEAEVTFDPITLAVQKRPGVSIRYSTQLDDELLNAWRKRAEDRKSPDNFNGLRFCLLIIANQCESILMNGQDVHDESGQLLTFGHKWIRDRYRAQRAVDAARRLLGSDPHVMLHANTILGEAGFADQAVEIEGEDTPTRAS